MTRHRRSSARAVDFRVIRGVACGVVRTGTAEASATGASEFERGPHANATAPAHNNVMTNREFINRGQQIGLRIRELAEAHKSLRVTTYQPQDA